MTSTLERIICVMKPYYSLFTMIIFFSALFISAYRFLISPSDLKISLRNESISYPNSISESYSKVHNYVLKADTLALESSMVYSFLLKTTDLKTITISNISNKTVRNIKFRHINVDYLTGWSVSTDFLTSNEETHLRKNINFDEIRKVVNFNHPIEIPPKSMVKLTFWGSFKADFFSGNVFVNHDNGDGYIEKEYLISGLKGYLINYSFEFMIIVLLIFCFVYYTGIRISSKL